MTYPISRYLNVQNAYQPSFSADGEHVIFLADLSGVPQVWQVLAQPAARPWWPDQLTFEQERVMGVWPAPQSHRILFARDMGGNEKAQLFLLDPATADLRALTRGHEDAMHTFGCWNHEGSAFYFAANRRHPSHFDVYRYALEEQEAELIWQHYEPGFLFDFAVTRDETRLAFVRGSSSFDNHIFELNLRSGNMRRLSKGEENVRYAQLAYTPGGRTLYLVTDLDSDFMHIRRLNPATVSWESVATPNWDVEMMALSPSGRYLAYTINVDGKSQMELIDMGRGVGLSVPLPDDAGVAGWWYGERLAFSPQEDRLAFSFSSPTRTSDVYVWNLLEDECQALTRSSHGGLPVERFAAPELIEFPTFDQRHIPAWYYRPHAAGDAPLPAVVLVHGGPESQYRPTFNFLAQYLVHHGYAVLAPNVRGSTGYGKGYSHLDDVERRMDSVADLAHAVQWLQAQAEVDAQRIAVYGGSYGGFMVLASLTNYPDLWAAGVDLVGISNFVTFLENTSDYRRGHREAEYGTLADDRAFLESIAPMRHVDRIKAPLMVIHGANDPRVPLSEAEQLVQALREREVPVELLVFDDEGHGIVKLKNKLQAYPAIVDFLDRTL
jgi:dipeptidyl aminopeptidase/acylaminoacyl peptidase